MIVQSSTISDSEILGDAKINLESAWNLRGRSKRARQSLFLEIARKRKKKRRSEKTGVRRRDSRRRRLFPGRKLFNKNTYKQIILANYRRTMKEQSNDQ